MTILTLVFPFASITSGTVTRNISGFNVLIGRIADKTYPHIVAILLLTVGILCIFDAIGLLFGKKNVEKVRIFLKMNHVTQVVTSMVYSVSAIIYVVTYKAAENLSVMTWTFIGTLIGLIVFFAGIFLERNIKNT